MENRIDKKDLIYYITTLVRDREDLTKSLEEYSKKYHPKALINGLITWGINDDRLLEIQDTYGIFDYTDYYSYVKIVRNNRMKLASIIYEKKKEFPSPEKLKKQLEEDYEDNWTRYNESSIEANTRRINRDIENEIGDRIELLRNDEFIRDLSKLLNENQLIRLTKTIVKSVINSEYYARRGKLNRYGIIDSITVMLTGKIYTNYPKPINEQRILERLEQDMKS